MLTQLGRCCFESSPPLIFLYEPDAPVQHLLPRALPLHTGTLADSTMECDWTMAKINTAPPKMPIPFRRRPSGDPAIAACLPRCPRLLLEFIPVAHVLFTSHLSNCDVARACGVCAAWRDAAGRHASLIASCLDHTPENCKLKAFETISRLGGLSANDRRSFGSVLTEGAMWSGSVPVRQQALWLLGQCHGG